MFLRILQFITFTAHLNSMKYLIALLIISLSGCAAQILNTPKTSIEFEDINHYPYDLISGKSRIIQTQEEMDNIFSVIHQKSGGVRLAPIPTVNDKESYLIFRPELKSTNDVEVSNIYVENNTLFVKVKNLNNPQRAKTDRSSPSILLKLLSKVSAQKITVQSLNN